MGDHEKEKMPLDLDRLWFRKYRFFVCLFLCWWWCFCFGSCASLHHRVEDVRCLCCKLGFHTDASSVLVEDERKWDTYKGKESGNGSSPLKPEVLVHVDCEERERGTKY